MVPKVHWYTIDPIWTPLWGYMGVQSPKNGQNQVLSWLMLWNHFRWKRYQINSVFKFWIQLLSIFLCYWENWENFPNFNFRIFSTWFSDSWQIFEWNFVVTWYGCLETHNDPLEGSLRPLTPKIESHQNSTQNFTRNPKIESKFFKIEN